MIEALIHPGLFLIVLSALYGFVHKHVAKPLAVLAPVIAYIILYYRAHQQNTDVLFHYSEHVFLLGTCFLVVLLAGNLFAISNEQDKNNDIRFALLYAGASLTAVLSNNLLVIFIALEIMMLAAVFLIFNGKTKTARALGVSYFKIHTFAGILFLAALIKHYSEYSNLDLISYDLNALTSLKVSTHYLILLALLISVAMPPFSYWLTQGYAAASPVGSVFLSAYTTKVAIFLIAKMFFGSKLLIYAGLAMGAYGVMFALFESNIRKIINFNIVSQLGLILISIGIGDNESNEGAALMLTTGVLYTALAMMCAGSVILALNKQKYYEIDRIITQMPFVFVCSIVACSSILALPLTVGYLGKYYLFNSEYVLNNEWLKYCITAVSIGMTFTVGMKFLVFVFMLDFKQKASVPAKYELSSSRLFALFILAFCCLAIGLFPENLLHINAPPINTLSLDSVLEILGTLGAFLILARLILFAKKVTLPDFDWIYRNLPIKIFKLTRSLLKFALTCAQRLQISRLYDNSMNFALGDNGHLALSKYQRQFLIIIMAVVTLALAGVYTPRQ